MKYFSGNPALFSCYAIIFVGLVESRETSESEPSTVRVMNILKKPQADTLSSFSIELWPISPIRLLPDQEDFRLCQ